MRCDMRMKLILLIFLLYLAATQAKTIKRNQKELSTPSETDNDLAKNSKHKPARVKPPSTTATPAIIAIEIVDENDNSTKSKNSKRTIDSSLGYGYQQQPNYFGATNAPRKFQIYKYSQHNIPPYRGPPIFNQKTEPDFTIQKSVTYELGSTKPEVVYNNVVQSPLSQYYQPGTVLYSTLNHQGHLGGLTSQLPHVQGGGVVPVIFVRVYTNQLGNSAALYPNLPKSHPNANLNTIDLASLLRIHLTNVLNQYDHGHGHQQVVQNGYDLPTHENYPDDAHTRVIFHSNKISGKAPANSYLPVPESYMNFAFESPHSEQQQQQEQYVYTGPKQVVSPTDQYVYTDQKQISPTDQYVYTGQKQISPTDQYVYTDQKQISPTEQDVYVGQKQEEYVYNTGQNQDQYVYTGQKQQNVPSEQYVYTKQYVFVPTPTPEHDNGQGYYYQNQGGEDHANHAATPETLVDTQTVPAQPYNYHAHAHSHRTSRSRKRNVTKRPVVVKRIKTETKHN